MSQLNSKVPFNKPSVLDAIPTHPVPLSPPETELEPGQPLHDENYKSPEAPTDTPLSRLRRVSTVPYSSGGLSNREPRSSQQQQRWLVVVVPPASLTREPPVLGHTLSSAPAGRFSNGILMPLFPTLYGQLAAIAREFNMPSTTGLCVYLQLQDSGISMMTPRISDESWQLLWGHCFLGEGRIAPLPPHGLPISGRIEFDIDLRRAKWFNGWMGHSIRERAETESMSLEPSMVPSHWRGDSRASLLATEQAVDESPSHPDANPPFATLSSRPLQRQLPRPLFLERRDASYGRSLSRQPSHAPSASQEFSSPEPPVQTAATLSAEPLFMPNALSPVVQESEEPLTAKKAELDSLVLQWRQGSVLGATSTALAAAGQLSLDPINMPAGTDVEVDLNDFAWSISSAGPPSESPLSSHWPEPLPSVHLQGRLQGSVCLTPSVCTSFGPPDYDWPDSPVSCVSRRPSPDLGMRMLEFVCLTPATATSWGPDDHLSPTLSEYDIQSRPPSVDLGVRGMGSRPATPSTATSWGPPDSPSAFPDSPAYVRTPDEGERGFSGLEIIQQEARPLAYSYYSTTQCWRHVWPYQSHPHRYSEQVKLLTPVSRNRSKVLLPEWPDFGALYPSDPSLERSAANKCQPASLSTPVEYPILELYTPVYPHNLDYIYPVQQRQGTMPLKEHPATAIVAATAPRMHSKDLLPEWPDFTALYPSDPRAERAAINKCQPVLLPRLVEYPFFDLYPTVYPHNLEELYPTSSQGQHLRGTYLQKLMEPALLPHQANYPMGLVPVMEQSDRLLETRDFEAFYPADSSVEQAAANKCQPVKLPCAVDYPFLEIYPSAYPYNLEQIYPSALSLNQNEAIDVLVYRRRAQLKELLPEWPDFASLYPADPIIERAGANKSQPVALLHPEGDPLIAPYPAVYPYSLQAIYPHMQVTSRVPLSDITVTGSAAMGHQLLPEYPDFVGLYPSDPLSERVDGNKSQPVGLPSAGYPLTVYPSVYPFNLDEIYRPHRSISRYLETDSVERAGANKSQPVASLPHHEGYPSIVLYPAVYPHNLQEIYPDMQAIPGLLSDRTVASSAAMGHQLLPEYPDFSCLYPSETSTGRVQPNKSQQVGLPNAGYPFLTIYPSVYPFNLAEIYRPYRSISTYLETHSVERAGANKLQPVVSLPRYEGYPSIVLYPAVYPHNLLYIYPEMQAIPQGLLSDRTVTSSTAIGHQLLPEYPDFAGLYPSDPSLERVGGNKSQPVSLPSAGYPFLTIYPSVYPFNLAEIYQPYRSISTHLETDSVERAGAKKLQPVACFPHYEGHLSIAPYPLVYPYSLQAIYPHMQATSRVPLSDRTVASSAAMGHQLLPGYPDFAGLYPSDLSLERVGGNKSQPVGLPSAGYPFLTIYPSVYPFNLSEIYGPYRSIYTTLKETDFFKTIFNRLPVYPGYPAFNLYPASQGYPTFEIYPPIRFIKESFSMSTLTVKLTSVYPAVEPYEPVYPYLVVYPQTQLAVTDEDLPIRPAGSLKLASTPSPTCHHTRASKTALTSGEQPDTQRRSSRSPMLQEIVPTAASINRSPHGKSKRTHLDLHLAVFGVESLPMLPVRPQHSYSPRQKPERTHHDLHLLGFGDLSQKNPQNLEDFVPERPSRSAPVSNTVPTRQRSRTGTVSSRPSAPAPRSAREHELSASPQPRINEMANPISIWPSVSTMTSSSLKDTSSNFSNSHTDPVPSSERVAPLVGRRRAPSVYGLPSSPADTKSVLNRVRSMNSNGGPRAASDVAREPRGPDRSNSLSEETNQGRTSRQSMVLERAKMFISDQGSKVSNDDSLTSRSQSLPQLDR